MFDQAEISAGIGKLASDRIVLSHEIWNLPASKTPPRDCGYDIGLLASNHGPSKEFAMLQVPAYRVFVSSTSSDLAEVREAVLRGILKCGHVPVGMELWAPGPRRSLDVIDRELENSDIYVGILGWRYGSRISDNGEFGEDNLSFTNYEYRRAKELGMPTLMCLMNEDDIERARAELQTGDPERQADKELLAFRNEVMEHSMITKFSSDLAIAPSVVTAEISQAIMALANHQIPMPGLIPADADFTYRGLPLHAERFLRPAFDALASYQLLTMRCKMQPELKRDLCQFFWHFALHDILQSKHTRLFFESGSTLAFLANELLSKMDHVPSIGSREQDFSVFTNNVLVLLQIMFSRSDIPYYFRPTGRPDEKYGATYGELDYVTGPNPGVDEPISEDHVTLVKRMAKYVGASPVSPLMEKHQGTKLLILAAASGVHCSSKNPGPHVGSYRNKLFKRALLQTTVEENSEDRAPVVFFVQADKFKADFDDGHCYSVCGEGFSWEDVVRETPIAFCVGATNIHEREEILTRLIDFGSFNHASPAKPRGEYRGHPFLVANDKFMSRGVVNGLNEVSSNAST